MAAVKYTDYLALVCGEWQRCNMGCWGGSIGRMLDSRSKDLSIVANPPEFFVIRKSKLEYQFPNNWFCFRILKIQLFFFILFFPPPCSTSIDDTVRPPATINIRARSLILRYIACAAGYNSLPVPVHVCYFLQFQGARPPPEPSPIRNYKLCRLAGMP